MIRDNGFLQKVAEEIHGKKGAPDYPFILCKRNEPVAHSGLHDVGGWEGLKRVSANGKNLYEIHHNFTLIIAEDGTCFIPDTPANREKLDRVSQPKKVVEKISKKNIITGKVEEYEQEVVIPPVYERMDKNLFEDAAMDDLATRVARKLKEMEGENLLPPEDEGEDEEGVQESRMGQRQIRTRRLKADKDLLAPIPRKR